MGRPPRRARLPQTARVASVPAPSGGWNAKDALPEMERDEAVILDNFIPITGGTRLRKGHSAHSTGLGGPVESLMEYAPPSGANRLFAATPTAIHDATVQGAAGAAVLAGLTSGRWQHTMFATIAGNFLCLVNGADHYHTYDGTAFVDQHAAVTGVDTALLVNIAIHKNRLWFARKGTLDAYHLPVGSIAGAATRFPLGPFCKLGGELLAIGTWTRDGGEGMDDLWVAVTTKGECLVYGGTDPATDWSLVGVFRIPEPVGRRCFVKAGGELGILTSRGLVPLSSVLTQADSAAASSAITDKISGAFTHAYAAGGTFAGWQVIEYPREKLLVVNVPIAERVTQHQFVMNTETGRWCRFLGMNAGCWSLLGDNLYFGGNDGTVYRYGLDHVDGANAITGTVLSAFSDFRTPQIKQFVAARPLFLGPEGYTPAVEMKIDFDTSPASLPASVVGAGSGSAWDVTDWDVGPWEEAPGPRAVWQSVTGLGQVAAPAMTVALSQEFVLNQIDVMYQPGAYF